MSKAIVATKPEETSIVATPNNPIGAMIESVMRAGVTADNVTAIEKLTALWERQEDRNAAKDYARAFAKLQLETPKIIARKPIPDANGVAKYYYAPLEEIMDQLQPLLTANGFSISFDAECEFANGGKGMVTAICIITHESGHSEKRKFTVRTSAPPKSSDAQADGATLTYAKRYALCSALNISIGGDNDARKLGDFITPEQADDLRRLVVETQSNEELFLRFAGAETYEQIREGRFDSVYQALFKKSMDQTVDKTQKEKQ